MYIKRVVVVMTVICLLTTQKETPSQRETYYPPKISKFPAEQAHSTRSNLADELDPIAIDRASWAMSAQEPKTRAR